MAYDSWIKLQLYLISRYAYIHMLNAINNKNPHAIKSVKTTSMWIESTEEICKK